MTETTHRGYTARIDRDPADGSFHARAVGAADRIHAEGTTPEAAAQEFEASVEVYLGWCAERGENPQRPAPTTA